MSILTKNEILRQIKKGNIKITPFNADNIGPASIDLTLGESFRVFKKSSKIVDAKEATDYQKITKAIKSKSIIIKPQETILGVTRERVTLSPNICGWLEGRSRFARLGLMVHISAPFMQPGIDNYPVLEISNMSGNKIRLHAGTKFCQFIFQRTIGKAKYEGKFKTQKEP